MGSGGVSQLLGALFAFTPVEGMLDSPVFASEADDSDLQAAKLAAANPAPAKPAPLINERLEISMTIPFRSIPLVGVPTSKAYCLTGRSSINH